MNQTKKGNPWHFGMKMHASVDAGTGYIHTITATAANVLADDPAKDWFPIIEHRKPSVRCKSNIFSSF